MKKCRVLWSVLAGYILVGLLVSGCTGNVTVTEDPDAGVAEPEVMADVGPRDYAVPADDANVINPIAADDASLERGAALYKATCEQCHGKEGRGDGIIAAGLSTAPVDYRAEHVMALSDGELFYIISNGIEGTDMLTFGYFEEVQRWDMVNYLNAFQE